MSVWLLSGLLVVVAGGWAWQLWETSRQLDALRAHVEAIARGEVHRFLPEHSRDATGRLAASINRLVDGVRTGRLGQDTERIVEQALLRETPNGFLVVDGGGRLLRINGMARRLLAMEGEPLGQPVEQVTEVGELAAAIVEATHTRATAERTATRARVDLLIRAVPLADGEGVVVVVLDITSIRQAERARRDFVANVSHELRTPITVILGYIESLEYDADQFPAHFRPMLASIARNGRRLNALVEDVLHLSRIEAQGSSLSMDQERLAPLVEDVVERFRMRALEEDISLGVEVPPTVEAWINSEAFEHALSNLVDNALKYTASGGAVRLRVCQEGEQIAVSVSDTGVGIAPEHQDRIFERFYRVDEGRARAVGGTGLGLALVKHLCKAMRGDVMVKSAVGQGSTFTLLLRARGE